MSEDIGIERRDGALAIRLNRPARRNAITVAMYAALADAIEQAQDDRSVRVITLSGEGEDFTAGNDLGDFLQEMPRDGSDLPVWRLLRALARNQVPLVAAVHGNAVGIGTTMLFHCDLVLAEDGTRFLMPFVTSALYRRRQVRCCCRGLPADAAPPAIFCSASPSARKKRRSSGWSAMSSSEAGCERCWTAS